jgi:Ca2+/Na+ antiporter
MRALAVAECSLHKIKFMKQVVFRYSIITTLVILVLGAIQLFVLMPATDYKTAEVTGYLTIVLAMIFIFFGIKKYRELNDGILSFGQGLKVGLLIALMPAVCFGLFDLLYTEVINPSWGEDYFQYHLQQVRESTPTDQVSAKIQKLEEQKETYGKPYILFMIMFLTVFIIGAMVAIISALTLRRSRPAIA